MVVNHFYQRQATLRSLAFFLAFCCLALTGTAFAGSFSVSPVRVELNERNRVVALQVRNQGSESASIQLELLQRDGAGVDTPTGDLLATPPIFTIEPGESQVIRVGLRRPPDPENELRYRLILQEIPPPRPAGFQGVQMALRLIVPVTVAPASSR